MVVGEIDKVGDGLKKVKEGQDQIKNEIEKNTTAIKELKREQGRIRDGLGVVKKDCEERHKDMIKRVEKLHTEVKAETQKGLEVVKKEMEQKEEEKTVELGKRIGKHEGEMKEGFKTTEEKIAKTDKEVAQVKEDLGKLSLETIGEGLNEVIEGKM